MLSVAVCSLRGAPGASTVAAGLAAAWPVTDAGRVVLVEADPAGGVLAARWALSENPGLLDLAARNRAGDLAAVEAAAQAWTDTAGVVVAPTDPDAVAGLLASASGQVVDTLAGLGVPVVVDVGRLSRKSMALPLAVRAARAVVVCPRRLDAAAGMAPWAARLVDTGARPVLVAVGDGPYSPAEVAASAGLELAGVLPSDRRGAAALWAGDRRRLRRSVLWRALRQLAADLAAATTTAVSVVPEPVRLVSPTEGDSP